MAKKTATAKKAPKARQKSAKASTSKPKDSNRRIRYAVVGLGHIAQTAMLPAFANARKNSELVALVSDDPEKLKKLGRKYKVKHTCSYSEYDELLKSGLVDAVYIALPNNMHREFTERALKHQVHVLCEKPLSMTSEDAQSMIKTARESNRKLMTAYRLHFDKANLEAMRLAASGELGELKSFNSTFSFPVREGNIRLDGELGGGPLYDIGVYCINAARYIFRDIPTEVFAFASMGGDARFKDVEESVSAVMKFSKERLATFTVSFSAAPVAFFEVLGTEAVLCLEQAYEYTEDMQMEIISASGKTKTRKFKKTDQFAPELLYFSDCILEDREPEPGGVEGLIDVRIVEALLDSIRMGRPVTLAPVAKDRLPEPEEQEISRPAIPQPDPFNAENPSLV